MRFLKWWLLLLPWVFIPGVLEPFLLPRQVLYEIGGWLLVVWLFTTGHPAQPFRNRWIGPGLCWVVVNLAYQFWGFFLFTKPGEALIRFQYYTILPSFDVLMGGLLVVALSMIALTTQVHRIQVSQWVCAGSTSVALYAIAQYLGFDQFFPQGGPMVLLGSHRFEHMVGTMGNVSYVSTYLGLTTPVFLVFKEKRYLACLGLVLLALALMGKSYGLLGAGSGLFTYAFLRRWRSGARRWLSIGLLSAVCLGAIGVGLHWLPSLLLNPRWIIWKEMISQLRLSSWTGYGLGGFPAQFYVNWESLKHLVPVPLQGSRWLWAHNDVLQLWYELGLIGGGLVFLSVWDTLKRVWPRRADVLTAGWLSCAVSCVVISCMNFPWHLPQSASLGIIIWSMNEANAT